MLAPARPLLSRLLCYAINQTRSLPPAKLFQDVLEGTAAKCSARAKLLQNSNQMFTPFAMNTFEAERAESKG